jgi:hypothetical protein
MSLFVKTELENGGARLSAPNYHSSLGSFETLVEDTQGR